MEQSLADGCDGEELIDTKVGRVHLTDSQLRPSQVCPYCMLWVLAWLLCFKILTLEWIDAHSCNKLQHTKVMERIW